MFAQGQRHDCNYGGKYVGEVIGNKGTTDVLKAALEYAKRGWHVLPLHTVVNNECTCTNKAHCSSVAKHPHLRNGLKGASTDPTRIHTWWQRWPNANVGIVTGACSGLIVLDVDDKDAQSGSASLSALESEYGKLPDTLVCATGRGRHYYFRYPDVIVKSSAGRAGVGLDVRGDGGYVVAPPSQHANGSTYQWVDADALVASVPDWLLSRMTDGSSHALTPTTGLIPVGHRNDALARIAGGLRASGMEQDGIDVELVKLNSSSLERPLPIAEVHAIAESIAQYSPGRQDNLPWFQFYVNDFLSNPVVRFGRDFQVGWYIQLLVEAWRHGGALPDDPEILWAIAGADSRESFEENCRLVLSQFEPQRLQDGTPILIHRWLANHHIEQAAKCRQRVEAAAKSAEKRKSMTAEADSDKGTANDAVY